MITLLFDGLIAVAKLVDRGLTAVEKYVRPRVAPRHVVDVQPAGPVASATAGTGGHPIRATSELLGEAAGQLAWIYEDRAPAVVRALTVDLIDRAAQFRAVGD